MITTQQTTETKYFTCGDGYGKEITLVATGADMITLAQRVWDTSDEEGVLQAGDMVPLFPGQSKLHTTTLLCSALTSAGCKQLEDEA